MNYHKEQGINPKSILKTTHKNITKEKKNYLNIHSNEVTQTWKN